EKPTGIVPDGCGERHEPEVASVRAFGNRLHAADGTVLLETDGHRALVVRHVGAVRVEDAVGAAPFVLAQLRAPAPELGGGIVEEYDTADGISGVNGDTQRLEEPAVGKVARANGFRCRSNGCFRRKRR